MFSWQLNKSKSEIKNGIEVVILNISSNVDGDSHEETNFMPKLLSTNRQV